MRSLTCWALENFPDVRGGDDLAALCCDCLAAADLPPGPGDVLVLAHKVVSKAEGRSVSLESVTPGPEALSLAGRTGKDARLCQVVLDESDALVRVRPGLVISQQRLGWICANAGVDASNGDGEGRVVLLPLDPDASARRIRSGVRHRFGVDVAVLIDDTQGRAHREGIVGVCIGLAGALALRSWIGRSDRLGRTLRASVEAVADEVASAATLLQGQADEGRPLVLVRGAGLTAGRDGAAASLQLPAGRDLFR